MTAFTDTKTRSGDDSGGDSTLVVQGGEESPMVDPIDVSPAEAEGAAASLGRSDADATPATSSKSSALMSKVRELSPLTVIAAAVAFFALVATAILGWKVVHESSRNEALTSAASDAKRAESVSLDYATGAAKMNFDKADEWRDRLTKNTSPELGDRLRRASESMEQLIVPLQWTSNATPIAAKVVEVEGNRYEVAAFVNVHTINAQAPDGIDSTATYKLTLDKSRNWLITDISGVVPGLAAGGAPAADPPAVAQTPAPTPAPGMSTAPNPSPTPAPAG